MPERDLELATRAAGAAGAILRAAFAEPRGEVRYKEPDQPVTEADFAADRAIREILLGPGAAHGWLSEESAGEIAAGESHWIVDPLDGTANFVAGSAEFAVSIALARGGNPLLGVVYNPVADVVYTAVAGEGAWRNGDRIAVRGARPVAPVAVCSHSEWRAGRIPPLDGYEVDLLGSTALKMARVAEGGADLYVSRTRKGVWDVAAGLLIVHEAGGIVRDGTGEAISLDTRDGPINGLVVAGRRTELNGALARLRRDGRSDEPGSTG